MKRFIDVHIPITKCNLQCHYCYVSHTQNNCKQECFMYSSERIGDALSQERLGGICHFNLCGLGETLIPLETIDIARELLENGHYVMIVTNATLSDRIKALCELPYGLRKRLGLKCSFHYLQLLDKKLIDIFFDNIDMLRNAGCSISVELTPSDELEPYIGKIKELCYERVGALCHVTIPRDMTRPGIELLSKKTFDEFCDIWSCFDSELFDFKRKQWGIKRQEFCYAGEWSGLLNLGNGMLSSCYRMSDGQNILDRIDIPIEWNAMGEYCRIPHCYNSHSLLGTGVIPEIIGDYSLMRDRIDIRDGSHWLNDEMREFLSHRLENYNEKKDEKERIKANRKRKRIIAGVVVKKCVKRIIRLNGK